MELLLIHAILILLELIKLTINALMDLIHAEDIDVKHIHHIESRILIGIRWKMNYLLWAQCIQVSMFMKISIVTVQEFINTHSVHYKEGMQSKW